MAEKRFVSAAKTEFLDVADYFLVGQIAPIELLRREGVRFTLNDG